MLTVKGLLERYPEGLASALQWGMKSYYKEGCDEPFHLNSTSQGFILNDEGRVQCYAEDGEIPTAALDVERDDTHWSDSVRWWDETLDKFYPHPWHPDKKILAFKCIRCCPSFTRDVEYEVSYFEDRNKRVRDKGLTPLFSTGISAVASDDGLFCPHPKFMLRYPEFFRPVYE